jgi:glutathione reductase (NADPH)
MEQRFDVVVIGSGTAGSSVAFKCRSAGWSVAVIDSLPFGGTCALRGCDPKKVLVGAAELLDFSQRLRATQSVKGTLEIDWSKLINFKRSFTDPVPKQKEQSFDKAGIKSFHGRAKFVDAGSIEVAGQRLDARFIVIAAGAKPASLHIPGEEHLITSTQFLELQQLPAEIVFVGGGYVAMEFAHVVARAGGRPTVLHRGERVLKRFDPDLVSKLVAHSREIGIVLHTQTTVEAIEKSAGKFVVHSNRRGKKMSFGCDLAVHAAGRVPDIDDLGLDKAHVEQERGQGRRPSPECVQPRGLCWGRFRSHRWPPLTPIAGYDGKVIASNLLEGNHLKAQYDAIPTVVFTVPALASVGLSEDAAKKKGVHFRKNYSDIGGWYSSRRVGEQTAAAKVLIDEQSNRILGAHLLGPAAEETINLFALAMRAGMTVKELKQAFFAYPTHASDVQYMV